MTEPAPILILGASMTGLSLTHNLLRKHLIPSSKSAAVPKIVLISSSTHTYWNPAAPRAIVTQEGLENDKLFLSVEEGLEQYKESGLVEFVHARIEEVNLEAKTVRVRRLGEEDEDLDEKILQYGQLVIATGATAQKGTPFRIPAGEGHKSAQRLLKEWQQKIEKAESIIVSGGGATGIETTGEIIHKYPSKSVTIVTGAPTLASLRADVDATAHSILTSKGVNVIVNTLVTSSTTTEDGKTALVLKSPSKEETVTYDLYIPAHGILPNNSMLPSSILNENGWVSVDDNFRVKGHETAWAAGDIASFPSKSIISLLEQVPLLVHNIAVSLSLPTTAPAKSWVPFRGVEKPELKAYKAAPAPVIIPIAGSGTGLIMGWKMWGWLVWMAKKGYLLEYNDDLQKGKGKFVM